MTRFLPFVKCGLVLASMFAVTTRAEAAEPCSLGVLESGKTYTFTEFATVTGVYTPSQTGPVKFVYTSNPLNLYSKSDYSEESLVGGIHSYVNGSQMMSYPQLEAGVTYYLYSEMTMMGGSFQIYEGRTELEVIAVNPTLGENETFSVSSNYSIDVGFNVPVTVGNALILIGEERTRVSSTVSNTYVTCDVADAIMDKYRQGLIKKGDVMTLRLTKVTDQSDSENIFGEDGNVEINFVMADKPGELLEIVNANQVNIENPFMSYYMEGDDAGKVSFIFDSPVSADRAVAKITYGNSDNLEVGVYTEEVEGKSDGDTVIFDFTGKLRRPIDMLPASTADSQPSGMNILFANIYTEDGQRVYTGRQSNPTGYSLSFKLNTLQYTISSDFTPGRGSMLTAGKEMEIWVMNGSYMNCDGIRIDYLSGGTPAFVVVPLTDVKVEADPVVAEDMIFTFAVPEMKVDEGTNVTISFEGMEFGDGLDHSKELTAEFGYDATTGVHDLTGSESDTVTVYNITGVCLLNNAGKKALESLPAGLYIINGKKTVLN